jgi:hypothetical protein
MMAGSLPFAVGCEVDLTEALAGRENPDHFLFSEFGGVVVEVDDAKAGEIEKIAAMHKAPRLVLGRTVDRPMMNVRWDGRRLDLSLADAEKACKRESRCNPLFA